MLALQKPKHDSNKEQLCTPNILPCRIDRTGAAKVSKRYWSPREEADGSQTVYFRGRRLRGRRIRVPNGYQGLVATKTDRIVVQPQPTQVRQVQSYEQDDDEDEDEVEKEESEPMKILEVATTFDELVVWGHEILPAADDTFVKGMEEWISFAAAIHDGPVKT